MEQFLAYLIPIANIIGIYFLRNKIFDLIGRLVQNLIKPIDLVIQYLSSSFTSIVRLNYRQQVLNVVFIVVSVILVWSEYSTLNEAVDSAFSEDLQGISIFGFSVQWSVFTAISYIAIATMIGFIGLELINFKGLFQGLLFNDAIPESSEENENRNLKYGIAGFLFLVLLLLAYLQGDLAIYRYVSLEGAQGSEDSIISRYHAIFKIFFFMLGFLTPIIAAIALISLDIFLAIIANFITVILTFFQRMLSAVYYTLEIIIQIISSPIDKLLEIFNIYQPENINSLNRENAQVATRLAPLRNNETIYNSNKASFHNLFNINVISTNTITLISDYPKIKIAIPAVDFQIKEDSKISHLIPYIKQKYPVVDEAEIEFFYIDSNGHYTKIVETQKILPFFKLTNYINIEVN